MLEVRNLSFKYGKKSVLKNVSFSVPKGALCGLLGPNGSGKSTLFKCCMNFLKPSSGSIEIGGREISSLSPSALAKIISYVPQEHKQPFPFTVREMVLMGRSPHMGGVFGLKKEDREEAQAAMELMEISHLAEVPCSQLSGGERQLVLIARAAAQKTPLMFLDEPTSALDFSNQLKTWRMLKKVVSRGVTAVACSHDPNHILWFSDMAVALSEGEVAASGPTEKIINAPLLSSVYKNGCRLADMEGKKIVFPGSF